MQGFREVHRSAKGMSSVLSAHVLVGCCLGLLCRWLTLAELHGRGQRAAWWRLWPLRHGIHTANRILTGQGTRSATAYQVITGGAADYLLLINRRLAAGK